MEQKLVECACGKRIVAAVGQWHRHIEQCEEAQDALAVLYWEQFVAWSALDAFERSN